MRQLMIQAPSGQGERIVQMAREANAVNVALLPSAAADGSGDVVIAHVPNQSVETILDQLEKLDEALVTLYPQPVVTLKPAQPAEVVEHATKTQRISPVELFLAGLQSVGSWGGFLSYAAAAGLVVWIGLFTNSAFLLIAAMLIAPFAGPAMNAALATARGDTHLLGRSVLRYFASILLTIAVAFVISLILGQQVVTAQMAQTASISSVAVLLPLTAGAAGALNLSQSERSSLVSGTATGVLVAAALAPPAGLVGMTAAMGRWDMMADGLFLLVLQLIGINLSGAIAFRLFGVTVRNSVYQRGAHWLFYAGVAVSAVALVGLLAIQFGQPPYLQRSSIEQRAVGVIERTLAERNDVYLAEADLTFTRPDIPGQDTLIAHLTLQRGETTTDLTTLDAEITTLIQARLLAQNWNVTPLVDVTILEPPPTTN